MRLLPFYPAVNSKLDYSHNLSEREDWAEKRPSCQPTGTRRSPILE